MRHRKFWRLSLVVLALSATAFLPTSLAAQGNQQGATLTPALAATRAALDKYQDPILAIHDGYLSTLACIEYSVSGGEGGMAYKAGGMGVHFLNAAYIGPKLDSLKPQVLIYEVVGKKLRLAAAEWFVPTQVSNEAPSIFGQKLQGPMEGHAPVLPAELHHWDLHVWLWKPNSSGVFSSTNPDVKCVKSNYEYSFDEKPPKMVHP
jgi:hypothetical protein